MSLEAEFRSAVKQHLEPLRYDLVAVLEQIIAYDYPAEVVLLAFQIFSESFTNGFPVRAFFLDSSNSEFFVERDGKADYPSPVDPGLLEINYVYSSEFEAPYLEHFESIDPYTLAGLELIDWFADCWKAAGGNQFSRMATIEIHDDLDYYDLVEGVWKTDD